MAKAKTYKGKSLRPGGGGKFARMVDAMKRKGVPTKNAKAMAAAMGRKKYGTRRFATMAAKGRKRAAAKRKGK